MAYLPKIEIGVNSIRNKNNLGEFVEMFLPGNPNQQYAALAIILELKWSRSSEYQDLKWIMEKHAVSQRIFERAREKLNKLGILEHATNLSGKTKGRHGWKLSSRFANSLRLLADRFSGLVNDKGPSRCQRDFAELNYILKR